jgi:hypothetical protein
MSLRHPLAKINNELIRVNPCSGNKGGSKIRAEMNAYLFNSSTYDSSNGVKKRCKNSGNSHKLNIVTTGAPGYKPEII